jgi:rhodanese-related sulfurtransferase
VPTCRRDGVADGFQEQPPLYWSHGNERENDLTTKITSVDPLAAQALLESSPDARLVDVRSSVEFEYVGHPVGAVHVPWKDFPDWQENPEFVAAVSAALGDDRNQPILLICRSGARSYSAAERLGEHGYTQLYNVEEGFEGDKDANRHRGTINGWRFRGLPWEQG